MAEVRSAELADEGSRRAATDGISSQAYTGVPSCQSFLTIVVPAQIEIRGILRISTLALFLRHLL
jgi:hypothetical protein